MYTRNIVETICKQVMLSTTDKFILQGNDRTDDHQVHPISSSYLWMVLNYKKTEPMEDGSKGVYGKETSTNLPK